MDRFDAMASSTSGGDDKLVAFPNAAERAALRKARQDVERQKLVNLFIDEAGSDALFSTGDSVAFADLIVAGHRETWPIRSKQFRYESLPIPKASVRTVDRGGHSSGSDDGAEPQEERRQRRYR